MKIIIAQTGGFCPGVRTAIHRAEQTLAECKGQSVYSFGPVIHNENEVDRLAQLGLRTVAELDEVASGTVVIRSHGAASEELQYLKDKGLEIVDATCVLVKRLQIIVKELEAQGYQVVIIGEANHAEVKAVVGFAKNAIVVGQPEDLHQVPLGVRLGIVCQTTQSPKHFGDMLGHIGQLRFRELKVINTLCRESCKRQDSAMDLCKTVDIMFVLGGLHSANTGRLAEMCKKFNPQTYHLQSWQDLDTSLLKDKAVVGVTAGASTPDWVIQDFVKRLEALK